MQNTLEAIWRKYDALFFLKNELNKRGYPSKDLCFIDPQLNLLMELINIESMNVLNSLLKKTYYRLLKKVIRGVEYIPSIYSDSENWVLNKIDDDPQAYIDRDVLVFSTKANILVFSKISRKSEGNIYTDGKWQ